MSQARTFFIAYGTWFDARRVISNRNRVYSIADPKSCQWHDFSHLPSIRSGVRNLSRKPTRKSHV